MGIIEREIISLVLRLDFGMMRPVFQIFRMFNVFRERLWKQVFSFGLICSQVLSYPDLKLDLFWRSLMRLAYIFCCEGIWVCVSGCSFFLCLACWIHLYNVACRCCTAKGYQFVDCTGTCLRSESWCSGPKGLFCSWGNFSHQLARLLLWESYVGYILCHTG